MTTYTLDFPGHRLALTPEVAAHTKKALPATLSETDTARLETHRRVIEAITSLEPAGSKTIDQQLTLLEFHMGLSVQGEVSPITPKWAQELEFKEAVEYYVEHHPIESLHHFTRRLNQIQKLNPDSIRRKRFWIQYCTHKIESINAYLETGPNHVVAAYYGGIKEAISQLLMQEDNHDAIQLLDEVLRQVVARIESLQKVKAGSPPATIGAGTLRGAAPTENVYLRNQQPQSTWQ